MRVLNSFSFHSIRSECSTIFNKNEMKCWWFPCNSEDNETNCCRGAHLNCQKISRKFRSHSTFQCSLKKRGKHWGEYRSSNISYIGLLGDKTSSGELFFSATWNGQCRLGTSHTLELFEMESLDILTRRLISVFVITV